MHYASVAEAASQAGAAAGGALLGAVAGDRSGSGASAEGQPAGSAGAPAGVSGPTAAEIAAVVRTVSQRAAASVQVPLPGVELGPDPSLNEWTMFAVGQPVWIWTDQTDTVDGSTTQQGIPITLVAHRLATSVSTGDGATITCTTATPRPKSAPPTAASPDCGHTWMTHGNYTVTATTSWRVDWSALGQSGSLTMQRSSSRTIKVGQLASVVVR